MQHVNYDMDYPLIVREGSGLVQISDSVIQNSGWMGVDADASAIHQLQMNNVTFVNNTFNRVFIEIGDLSSPIELIDNVVLSPQNNLEAYQIGTSNGHNVVFDIPAGITLTLEPGVTLIREEAGVHVFGHLEAIGTPTMPITLTALPTTAPGAYTFWSGGSGVMQHVNYDMDYPLIVREGSGIVQISDSVIRNSGWMGVDADASAIHQLQMENVTFVNNAFNRVFIEIGDSSNPMALIDDVVLSPQNNLEGYQIGSGYMDTPHTVFDIPAGITLTVAPSVTIFLGTNIKVEGKLQALGIPTSPITFTSATIPPATSWQGIHLNGGEMDVAYANIQSVDEGIIVNNATLNLNCVQFSQNNRGIWVEDWGSSTVNMVNGLFAGNTVAGLQNDHADQIDARYSWWDDASGPSGIGAGTGECDFW